MSDYNASISAVKVVICKKRRNRRMTAGQETQNL